MTDQEQQSTETTVSVNNLPITSNDQDQLTENTEKLKENESNSSEQRSTGRITIPQDIRYSTEQNDREKLLEKYNNYQISDINACNIRFLTDNRQKKILFGRNEEENANLHSLAKTFNVNMFPGYQHTTKHSYKIFGTEANTRKCLVEIMTRMFKRSNRSTQRDQNENNNNQQATTNTEKPQEKPQETEVDDKSSQPSSITEENNSVTPNVEETETSTENEKSPPHPTSIFITTINPDSSIIEEQKPITPSTPNINEEKTDENIEQEQFKFVPLERKPQFTFIMLISSQGQEKIGVFFAGSLQQRLNVVVTNPVKLPKFGDKQIQNELSITGESIENLTDATLQIAAFINDVLGVPVQPYQYDEEPATNDNTHDQHSKNDHHSHHSSSSQYEGRTFFNRNRSGAFEQVILLRSDCVPRIIGTRGSNIKRIQTKCHLRDMIVGRQADENGYVECTLTAYQTRNLNFAIDTIRNFLRNEDESAVLVIESNHDDVPLQDSPHLHALVPPSNTEQSSTTTSEFSQTGINFMTKSLSHYPQPSYNFQNTPSFDFTHQATSASRKTNKRPGELNEQQKTPHESQNQQYETISSLNYLSNSPKHISKRSCPETKEIDCTTDEGFWIQKQYYYALDDASKQLFDSLIEKLDKIRITTEENAAKKQQRLVGRNRSNKSRVHTSSISYLNEDNNHHEKDLTIKSAQIENNNKVDPSSDVNEEKENKQETASAIVNQD